MIFLPFFRIIGIASVLVFGSFVLGDVINERAKHEYLNNPKAIPHEILARQWIGSWFCFWVAWDRVNTYQVMYQKQHLIEPRAAKQIYLRELRKEWPSYLILAHFAELWQSSVAVQEKPK